MSKQKFYAVRKGKKPGIYLTWSEAKTQVENFSNAEYKSFSSKKEALEYMKSNSSATLEQKVKSSNKLSKVIRPNSDTSAVAYTDGSYRVKDNTYSLGAVILLKDKEIHISQRFDDTQIANLRNVAGEVLAAIQVINFCLDHNIKNLKICHDYQGVSNWITKEWETKIEFTKKYKQFVDDQKSKINISFEWIKAHNNNKYNELADQLANNATFDLIIKEVK